MLKKETEVAEWIFSSRLITMNYNYEGGEALPQN